MLQAHLPQTPLREAHLLEHFHCLAFKVSPKSISRGGLAIRDRLELRLPPEILTTLPSV